MAKAPVVGIVGMAALRRDLKRLTDDETGPLYKAIKAAGKAAVEPVAEHVRATLPHGERATDRAGRLRASVRTSGTKTGGAVRMGSRAVPWAGWVDFGGSRPDGSDREYVATGRYLYPAAAALAGRAADEYGAAIAAVLESSGIWTNDTSDGSQVRD